MNIFIDKDGFPTAELRRRVAQQFDELEPGQAAYEEGELSTSGQTRKKAGDMDNVLDIILKNW